MEATLETPWTGGATPGATPFAAHQLFDERSSVWADVELECRILNKDFGVAGRAILPRPDEMTICMTFLLKKFRAARAILNDPPNIISWIRHCIREKVLLGQIGVQHVTTLL
nr:uncharacterized protein LOC114825890 [Malus domestica]